ncbi:cysteine desulfurase CsdA [Candidatus Roizmanbacteria bacterium CG10_big_fil_rev_8_21_14_0_10_39_12]|uniref:Cysteine desulfurase n=1 Tax=Candidatus Roizmanbacteria bacterium CG10_big_fil_rev_8_21_14_0_10_39_12 TaxID=1974852 RepID=A0A2M8KN30_9BACT|nr:MAG: cysteine desulfurase CsdA [Candidatus Roizmanbacteria bacterium CG10_big_fil_rev_8_21_14_0_10_39_12]
MNVKKDFPIFSAHPELVYLDSGATSLKPQSVIDKMSEYYTQYSANIHRGIYKLSERASQEYEDTRAVVAKYINANRSEEIVFTRNATESLNLVASTLGQDIVNSGDEIVTTVMEHHANFVPWQQLAFGLGADFKVIDINEDFELSVVQKSDRRGENHHVVIDLKGVITKKTKILAVTLVSNTLGTINPVKEIIQVAKAINPEVITIVDAAQAVPHMKVDVQDLGCDFLAFSSHKMLGPTGVGVLWGKYDLLEKMPPYQYGGDMIRNVSIEETTFADVPHKFEAGTPNISGVIALKEAIAYLENLGFDTIRNHEKQLAMYAARRLNEEFSDEIVMYGPRHIEFMAGIISFNLKGIHPHDIAQILDENNIAVRAGHHCTMPLHSRLNIPATVRTSFYIYNNEEDVEKLVKGVKRVREILRK